MFLTKVIYTWIQNIILFTYLTTPKCWKIKLTLQLILPINNSACINLNKVYIFQILSTKFSVVCNTNIKFISISFLDKFPYNLFAVFFFTFKTCIVQNFSYKKFLLERTIYCIIMKFYFEITIEKYEYIWIC